MRNMMKTNSMQQTIKTLLCAAALVATASSVSTLAYAQSASASASAAASSTKPMMNMDKMKMDKMGMDKMKMDKMDKMKMDKSMSMHKSMDGMQEKMAAVKMSGDPDIDFAAMMKIHHEGAVDMAQAEIDAGKNPAMIKMAKAIIAAQKKEIAQFDAWLKEHPSK
jgi:uncharacterized protein (DUF305 family)